MEKVKFAVVGAGWISQEAFLPAVRQTENATVTALVSGNPGKARQLADFHGVENVFTYDEFDTMAKSGTVDAIYVATPNSSHADFAIRAMRHGLHVMVEKPLATTPPDAERMIATARETGRHLMTAYRLHNDPATLKVMELVHGGIIGEARHVFAGLAFQILPENHRLKASHWGGPLQDVGVYCVNAARHVFGSNPVRTQSLSSHGDNDPRFREVEEGVAATLEFSRGRIAQFYAGFGTDNVDTLQVHGSKGSLTLVNAFRFGVARRLILARNDVTEVTAFPETDNFSGMIAYFSDCIRENRKPLPDGEEGLADMQVLAAIEAAHRELKPQPISCSQQFQTLGPDMLRSFPPARDKLLLP